MRPTYEEEVFGRFAGRKVLLDSNLLLLFLSGTVDLRLLERFKRVREFTVGDYELLVRLLGSFRVLVTTPHVLTEVSNLANSLSEGHKEEWFSKFAALLSLNRDGIEVRETWIPSRELAEAPEFVAFGITDCALANLASNALVITTDFRLSGVLRSKGVPVLNFADLRRLQILAHE